MDKVNGVLFSRAVIGVTVQQPAREYHTHNIIIMWICTHIIMLYTYYITLSNVRSTCMYLMYRVLRFSFKYVVINLVHVYGLKQGKSSKAKSEGRQ